MQEHGSYSLEVKGQTHILKAYGAWNYETVQRWGAETKQLVSTINLTPWACLIDLTEWELATPDAREYVYNLNLWFNDNNLKHLAIVYSLYIQKEILKISQAVLTNVEIKYFDTLEEAEKWLNSIGF
jgi:hypothetical protein